MSYIKYVKANGKPYYQMSPYTKETNPFINYIVADLNNSTISRDLIWVVISNVATSWGKTNTQNKKPGTNNPIHKEIWQGKYTISQDVPSSQNLPDSKQESKKQNYTMYIIGAGILAVGAFFMMRKK